jgi:hypothetical protein
VVKRLWGTKGMSACTINAAWGTVPFQTLFSPPLGKSKLPNVRETLEFDWGPIFILS